MPEIKPFCGFRYNAQKVTIGDVVAPPYDVIAPQQRSDLYMRSQHNVIRLILNSASDPYLDAQRCLLAWKESNILTQDGRPNIYFVAQSFTLPDGRKSERKGFIAACKLEDLGKGSIFPHEKTLSKPKEDRLKLFEATDAMFSQIFSLYPDPGFHLNSILDSVMMQRPEVEIDFEQVNNRMWLVDDPTVLNPIQDFITRQKVLVADGHHRYETALMYSNAQRLKNPNHTGKEPYNFVPMFFTNMHEPDLVILPTHRIVHSLPSFNATDLIKRLKQHFDVEACSGMHQLLKKLAQESSPAFGVATGIDKQLFLARSKHGIPGVPAHFANLDVAILHTGVFKNILKMSDEDQEKKLYLDYEKEAIRAVDRVWAGTAQAAFILNPTRVEQVRAIAEAGFVMPQKSTFFYPKLLSGLVTYSFTGS